MSARDLIADLCAGLSTDPELWIVSRLILNPFAPPTTRAAAVVWAAFGRLRIECSGFVEEGAPS